MFAISNSVQYMKQPYMAGLRTVKAPRVERRFQAGFLQLGRVGRKGPWRVEFRQSVEPYGWSLPRSR